MDKRRRTLFPLKSSAVLPKARDGLLSVFNSVYQLNFVMHPRMCRWLFGCRCHVGKLSISLHGLMTPDRKPLWCSLGANRTTGPMWKMSFLFSHSSLALAAAPGKRWNASCLVHFIWLVTPFLVLGPFHILKKLLLGPQLCGCRSDDGELAWHSWPLAPHKKRGDVHSCSFRI